MDWAHPRLKKLVHPRELIHVPRSTVLTDNVWFHGLVQPAVVFRSQQLNQLCEEPATAFFSSVPRGQHQCILKAAAHGRSHQVLDCAHLLIIFNKKLRKRSAHHTSVSRGLTLGLSSAPEKAILLNKERYYMERADALPPVAVPTAWAW